MNDPVDNVARLAAAAESFRTGLAVNWVLITIAAGLSAAHEFAAAKATTPTELGAAVVSDLRRSLFNLGFALYVSAGSAFLGSIPMSQIRVADHALFFSVWTLFAVLLITVELAKARVAQGSSDGWTLSRILAIPAGVAFSYWVWLGASGLGS